MYQQGPEGRSGKAAEALSRELPEGSPGSGGLRPRLRQAEGAEGRVEPGREHVVPRPVVAVDAAKAAEGRAQRGRGHAPVDEWQEPSAERVDRV